MSSSFLENKLRLLNCDIIDIEKDDFYYLILKIEEEKIRLYKPKEREKLDYRKEKNYIEQIIKYLMKLNINTKNINKNTINEKDVRIYILNNLTTLALIDEYKDLINYEENENEDDCDISFNNNLKSCENEEKKIKKNNKTKENIINNFYELEYLNNNELHEYKQHQKTLEILKNKINEIFRDNNIPLIQNNFSNNNINNIHLIISSLKLIKEKLKNKKQVQTTDYEEFFNFNIHVTDKQFKDIACILKYLLNQKLKNRKSYIKTILNEIQILTYNPIIDIKQAKVGI